MEPHRPSDRHYPQKTAFAREQLRAGRRISDLANQLYREGAHGIQIVLIFHQATGADIGELLAFGQWWGAGGVTDAAAFDEWAIEVFGDPPRVT
jgi:hypothetical protein